MLTNNKIKLINSLKLKKNRESHGLFVAEGDKVVQEFIDSDLILESLYTTNSEAFPEAVKVSEKELARISNLKTANSVLGLVRIPDSSFQLDNRSRCGSWHHIRYGFCFINTFAFDLCNCICKFHLIFCIECIKL